MPRGNELIEDIDAWTSAQARLVFWWLGQGSLIVKLCGKTIYIDPYLSENEARLTPPLLAPDQVTNADLVLCTHDHTDHIDPGSIPGIAAASLEATFAVPEAARQRVIDLGVAAERVVGLNADQSFAVDDVTVTAIKARHEFFDRTDDGLYPYLGYVVQSRDACLYAAGDTVSYDGLLTRLGEFPIDVVFLPINGRDARRYRAGCIGNLTYQEAVDLAGELRPRLAVPVHYDMFASNSEDPRKFADYLDAKYPDVACWVGSPGERVEVECK